MLEKIALKFFKCFEEMDVSFSNLTLLSGQNASGKSTIIQALVLLHQTMQWQEWTDRLLLNGRELQLGMVADVVDSVHGRDSIAISLTDSQEGIFQWTFSGQRDEMSMGLKKFTHNNQSFEDLKKLHYLLPESLHKHRLVNSVRKLTYITAERIGPRQLYALSDVYNDDCSSVGISGEFAASVLYKKQDKIVLSSLCQNISENNLFKQVIAWMRVFFYNSDLKITPIPEANSVRIGIRNSDDTDFHRPINVGFGVTQVFPILVAVLAADQGDIIVIENPEVHLHPAGQAQMGVFLSLAANAGIQIIVESHSDHILNGIRRSVKSKKIDPNKVAIHFFKSRKELETQRKTICVDVHGNLDQWPEDFFDQFDKDMDELAGWND